MLVALFTFHSYSPIGVLRFQMRWYHVVVFCLVVFAANGARFSVKAAGPFLLLAGLTIFGAAIAPLRAGFSFEVLQNATGIVFTLLSFSLLLPTLASERCRRLVILALLASSLFWLAALRSFVAEMGDGARLGLAGPGQDRNFIAFILGIGLLILLGLGLFWTRHNTFPSLRKAIRLTALAGSVGLLCCLPFTFSRSGILVAILMVLASLTIYLLKNRVRGLPLVGLVTVLVVGLASYSLPRILAQLPSWEMHFDRLMNWQTDDSMSGRRDLVRKGVLMVWENPIVGVGAGMSKSYSGFRKGWLIHNGYLTTWAELGLPGIAATLILVSIWLAEIRRKIRDRRERASDLICLLVGGAMLAMNFFLDYATVYWFIAVLICGLTYERRLGALSRRHPRHIRSIFNASSPAAVPARRGFAKPQSGG